MLTDLDNIPDTYHINTLRRKLSNLLENSNILIGIEAVLTTLARGFKQPCLLITSQHLRRQTQKLRDNANRIFWHACIILADLTSSKLLSSLHIVCILIKCSLNLQACSKYPLDNLQIKFNNKIYHLTIFVKR